MFEQGFEAGRFLSGSGRFDIRTAIAKTVMLPNIVLSAEEAERFHEGVWDLTSIKNVAQKVTMKSQKKKIRHLGLTDRIMHPEGTMDATKIVTQLLENAVELSTVESRAAVLIKDSELEDMNIGSAQEYKAAVMRIIMNKLANEIEEAAWISESSIDLSSFGSDDIRSTKDGWRFQIDHSQTGETYINTVTGSAVLLDASNTITAKAESFAVSTSDGPVEFDASAPYHPDFKLGYFLPNLPVEYLKLLPDMRFFMNPRIWWKELQHERKLGTEISHRSLRSTGPDGFGTFDNVPVVQFNQMPLTMKIDTTDAQKEALIPASGDLTDVLMTPANNLVYGVQLDLMMETERSASSRGNIYWFTVRDDVKIRDVNACVLCKRMKVA